MNENFSVQFAIDGEVLKRDVDVLSGLKADEGYELSATFANATPRIHALTAMQNGKPVQVADPGSQVTLHALADDPDGDQLEFRWVLPDAPGFVGPTTNPELVWKVPNQKKRHAITVVATDKRGGYTQRAIIVDASSQRATFSGTVLDPTGKAIDGAQVDVNGRLISTNSKGWFSFNVPIADKYVMNIRKPGLERPNMPGFGTASFIYQGSVVAGRWTLRRAQVTTVDPTQPIRLQQKKSQIDCPGPIMSKIDWTPYLHPGLFDWQDQHGNSQALVDLGISAPKSVQNVMRMLSWVNRGLVETLSQVTGVGRVINDRQLPCGPGIKVDIPANSLVETGTNRPPTGQVQIALSSVALTTGGQMPGDYTVVDQGGKVLGMESFGAGSVEIGNATRRYNLKPGATATVTIPVDVTQLSGGAKPTIPLLYYDEQKGIWLPEGQATLTGAGAAAEYTAMVKHFSAINADVILSEAACVAVEVDSSLQSSLPFNVEVVMQPHIGPDNFQVRLLNVDSAQQNVIYNLPLNSDIVLTPIVSGTKPDGSSGDVPLGVFVVNTGGPQTGPTVGGIPQVNNKGTYYDESNGVATGPCGSRVTLKKLDPPTLTKPDEFLQGLSFQASNITELAPTNPNVVTSIENGAKDYYKQADPRDLRASFNLFKTKNRFGQPVDANKGEVETSAQYANSGDLGFGRDMHCRKNFNPDDNKFDYACYVTNFGQPPKFSPDQQDANETSDITKADATVAMEFSRVENSTGIAPEFPDNDRAVKFYVYNTSKPDDTTRITKADLDGHGERPVPQLCMVCHGGNLASVAADPTNPLGPKAGAFTDRTDIISMRANFLPFDLHLFNYPTAKDKTSQQPSFKRLNELIVKGVSESTGTGNAIVEVIDAFYKNSATQLEDAVIDGWALGGVNASRLYRDVLARACRTCHIAEPFGAPTFKDQASFDARISSVQARVCSDKIMPHAQRTNDVFWQSLNPNMAAFLELYGQTKPGWVSAGTSQCGQFFQPGLTPTSQFQREILPILQSSRCVTCHGPSNTANANFNFALQPAQVYDDLRNKAAKDGSRYISPGDPDPQHSKLYQRISTGVAGGTRMPQGQSPLDTSDFDGDLTNDQQEILNWITGGAPGP